MHSCSFPLLNTERDVTGNRLWYDKRKQLPLLFSWLPTHNRTWERYSSSTCGSPIRLIRLSH